MLSTYLICASDYLQRPEPSLAGLNLYPVSAHPEFESPCGIGCHTFLAQFHSPVLTDGPHASASAGATSVRNDFVSIFPFSEILANMQILQNSYLLIYNSK
jgi:hypothetical protein